MVETNQLPEQNEAKESDKLKPETKEPVLPETVYEELTLTDSAEQRYIQVRKFRVRVPNSRAKRMWLGGALTVVGVIPGPPGPAASVVGLTILSIDNPGLRKARRKSTVWIGRRTWARQKNK